MKLKELEAGVYTCFLFLRFFLIALNSLATRIFMANKNKRECKRSYVRRNDFLERKCLH